MSTQPQQTPSHAAPTQPTPETTTEIEEFLNRWEYSFETEEEDCLPDHVLIALANESRRGEVDEKALPELVKPYAEKLNQPGWPDHIRDCLHCKNIIKLLQDTERPKVSIEQIFARANRKAQEALAKKPRRASGLRRLFFGWGEGDSVPAYIPIMAVAVLLVFWFSPIDLFRRGADEGVTVSFNERDPRNEKSKKVIETLNAKFESLKESPRDGDVNKKGSVEEYNQLALHLNELHKANELRPEDRGPIASLMVRYKNEIERRTQPQTLSPPNTSVGMPAFTRNDDATTITDLYTTVGYALTKKNSGGDDNQSPQGKEEDAIDKAAEEITVLSLKDNEVIVEKLSPGPITKEHQEMIDALRNYANRNNREIQIIGSQMPLKRISPDNAFVQRVPE